MRVSAWIVALLTIGSADAQPSLLPSAASTQLYFAQLADGGPPAQKWTVTLILNNPGGVTSVAAAKFFNEGGLPLLLDFGQGPSATLNVTLPAGGTATFTSLGASATTTVGWATVTATNPVSGTILYHASSNTPNTLPIDVAAAGTGPTYLYDSFASYNLGIALVNPSATQPIDVLVSVHDTQGGNAGTIPETLAPLNHVSFDLFQTNLGIPRNFTGSITIASADNPPVPFVAWTVNSRTTNLFTPLPPGQLLFPSSYQTRASDVFAEMISAQKTVVGLLGNTISGAATYQQQLSSLQLSIESDTTARASVPGDGKMHISTAMLEVLGDSRSALGFLMGNLLVVGLASGSCGGSCHIQTEADLIGVMTLLQAGYDPNGPAALLGLLRLGELEGVSLDPAILTNFSLPNGMDSRLTEIWSTTQMTCSQTSPFTPLCQASHNLWHQQYPASAP